MTDNQLSRRRVLQLSGAAAVVTVAGCLGGDDDLGTGAYGSYVSADNGEVFAVYMDVAALSDLEDDDEEDEPEGDDEFFDEEPLIGIPTAGMISLMFVAGFSLESAGLGDLIDDDAMDDYETEVDEMLLTGDTAVITGSIDTDEITERIEQEATTEYEETEETGGFTVYEAGHDDEDDDDEFGFEVESAIAISDDELLVAERREQVEHVIDTIEGDRTPAVEEFEEFEWLLSVIEESEIALAAYAEDGTMEEEDDDEEFEDDEMLPADDVIDQATGFAGGLAFNDDEVTADAGLLFDALDDDLEGEIESEFNTETTDVEFEFDDDRVTISATFEEDDLDE